jgi:hypothetical protein
MALSREKRNETLLIRVFVPLRRSESKVNDGNVALRAPSCKRKDWLWPIVILNDS